MAAKAEFYIKKSTLETMIKVLEQKNKDGISLCVAINSDTNQHGQNVWVTVAQTKEENEAKKPKFTIGNGMVYWTDQIIKVADKVEKPVISDTPDLGDVELPF